MADVKSTPPQTLSLLTEEASPESPPQPKRLATTPNAFLNDYVEDVSPAFDPKRVLIRRVFFINEDKSKYVSIGYYPTRNYEPMVEFGSLRNNQIILTEPKVRFLAEIIPNMCESLCNG
jgi:hypothetical protein